MMAVSVMLVQKSRLMVVRLAQWVKDEREGMGVETGGSTQHGVNYSGSFRGGVKHGLGVCSWPDGSEYHGKWEANSITGAGTYNNKREGRKFSGQWNKSAKPATASTIGRTSDP